MGDKILAFAIIFLTVHGAVDIAGDIVRFITSLLERI